MSLFCQCSEGPKNDYWCCSRCNKTGKRSRQVSFITPEILDGYYVDLPFVASGFHVLVDEDETHYFFKRFATHPWRFWGEMKMKKENFRSYYENQNITPMRPEVHQSFMDYLEERA